MADNLDPVVVRVRSDPKLESTGTVTPRVSVDFMVGTDGPFTITLPETEFSELKVRELMAAKATVIRALRR